MNFGGHTVGGIIAGGLVVGVVSLFETSLPIDGKFNNVIQHVNDIPTISLFLITFFMSHFPDLDTNSIPQRWFLRAAFLGMVLTYFQSNIEIFSLIAFLSILPMLHKHRGWTHWKITPWLIAILLSAVQEYHSTKDSWFSSYSWNAVLELFFAQWEFVFAIVAGHYTHLLLDLPHIKWLPFIDNPRGHH